MTTETQYITLENVKKAASLLRDVVLETPLQKNQYLSEKYEANIVFKREDLQEVRSYKIRGAYHKISSLTGEELEQGVVCASAGNHAQGVAFSCKAKKIKGVIFMPTTTPNQKIEQVKMFGGDYVEVVLNGDTYDDASYAATDYCKEKKMSFVHPFHDIKVIEGQATIALEILAQSKTPVDYLFLPVGGGGLAAGVSSIFKELSPNTKIIGVEPKGAPSMSVSIINGFNTKIDNIDKFIDGASVQKVGDLNFEICKENLDEMVTVHEGKVCQTILDLYNKNAIVVEPAGALTTAVLGQFSTEIKGKNVVCLISGSNNDITRTEEIKERALLHSGHKHYFIIKFPQRAGALLEFLNDILGPNDDITHFEYSKKHNRNSGPAIVGLEISNPRDLDGLILKMKTKNFFGEYLNDKPDLFQVLI
ncbi:threonine ammonia-lyase [Maribacter hydrothermalis]|uniref:L-threonine dehydratase n=1 Tax=Maribacter hydrothermalis TaxID=1836467 RepID=A0A1B7Z608_9FLAO|nr:threonine ammonia-lyase [Maribacter hydrothermalis]APQ18743.1 threonine dehydratase [Maribacter hydrothermalis]OBR38143.1 threonine dehydratase [Maribacter hydrothermalis]